MSAPRTTRRRHPRRQNSHAFPVPSGADRREHHTRHQIQIDWVPPALHRAVMSKARRSGTSLRALVLAYLQQWSEQPAATPAADKGEKS